MKIEVFLAVDVLLHILVDVQVVGRHIGDDRHVRRPPHGDELEARKLHHRRIVLFYLFDLRKQRLADVAAKPHPLPLSLQELGDQRSGGINPAGAEVEKTLHLAGDHFSLFPRLAEGGGVEIHPRRPEDHIGVVKCLQIPLSQPELRSLLQKALIGLPHLLRRTLVADGDPDPLLQKLLDQAGVAHADPDKNHPFFPQLVEKTGN